MIRGERRAGKWTAWVAFLALSAGLAGTAWPASFQGLGFLTGDNTSVASSVSGDGSVAVGTSGGQAFRWTESGGMVGLSALPGDLASGAHDISTDGLVIVGYSENDLTFQGFRWTQAGGMTGLGYLPGHIYSMANAASADGSVIVGTSGDPYLAREAFCWTEAEGMKGLGFLPGHDTTIGDEVSGDGSTVVGYSESATAKQAFRWTAAGGMEGLGFLPGYTVSTATGASYDGSVIVGWCEDGSMMEGFRWTSGEGMVGLGHLPYEQSSRCWGVSADGSVIVGGSASPGGDGAWVWDARNGLRHLRTLLIELGANTTGWAVNGNHCNISADGMTIVGQGWDAWGRTQAWLARGSFLAPHIESNPQAGLIEAGRLTTLTLVDGGSPPYAWYKDDVPLTDDPPRMTGTATRTLTFSPVELTDEGVYHVTYDDGAKAPAQTPPFYMPVLPEGTLPALGTAGLVLLALALCVVALVGRRRWFRRTLLGLTLTLGLAGTAWPASFQGLGSLPGFTYSDAAAVSRDGSVVVGMSLLGDYHLAFRWTEAGGMVDLGLLPGTYEGNRATGVSADGSLIVGWSATSDGGAFRWTEATGIVAINQFMNNEYMYTYVHGVSADGMTLVGGGVSYIALAEAFRWRVGGVIEGLGLLHPQATWSEAFATSADGSVVVGASEYAPDNRNWEAFRWTESEGMVGLGWLQPGIVSSSALAVSADGSVVVGRSNHQAYRWTAATGMVGLGFLPGHHDSQAYGVSADGSIVVGYSDVVQQSSARDAFIWDADHGTRSLAQVLADCGVDTTGWRLREAHAISADGLTVVGTGSNPLGREEAWIARGPFDLPHIESNPQPGLIEAGRLTTLTLVDGGSPPYAWYKDDVPLIDNPPRMTGTNTRTLTFSPVEQADEGVYHVTYDDGAKAPAQTPPFYMPVLPEGTLPALGTAGLVLLALALCVVVVVRRRRWLGHVSALAPDACGNRDGRSKELRRE